MSKKSGNEGGGTAVARRRMSPARRREAIAATACQLALTEGLQNLTHRNIAAQLGVTHALVVHYEPSIESLRLRVYQELLRAEFETVESHVAGYPDAVHKLSEVIRLMSRPGREDYAGVWLDGWSLGRRHQETADTVRAMMDRWQAMVAAILELGTSEGVFDVPDADSCAWEIIALLDGFNAHTVVGYRDREQYRARIAAPIEARVNVAPGTLNENSSPLPQEPTNDSPPQQEEQ